MMLTDLAHTLRAAGLRVVEVPGWQTRGRGEMTSVQGVIDHHTAGASYGSVFEIGDPIYPSLPVVRDGRTGLPGPLSQLGLARDGSVLVIAAGVSNHAGAPDRPRAPMTGNTTLIGIEAESTGVRRADGSWDWTPEQRAAYPLVCWALARRYGLAADRIIGHGSADPIGWAPSRKIDPAGIDMAALRRTVANPAHPFGDDLTAQFEADVRKRLDLDRIREEALDRDLRAELDAMREREAADEVEDDALDRDLRGDLSIKAAQLSSLLKSAADTRQALEETRALLAAVALKVGVPTTPPSGA